MPCSEVEQLRALIADTAKGIDGVGLRRSLRPQQILDVTNTLRTGDAKALSLMMRDVAGEAVSLGAGHSTMGPQAMEAISDAQSQCLVQLRESTAHFDNYPSEELAAQKLLSDHQESLLKWVQSGVAGSDELHGLRSELSAIGQDFLQQPHLRMAAISVFIASTEVLRAGLGLFHSHSPKPKP